MPTVTVRGPIFSHAPAIVRRGIQNTVEELIQKGEQRLDDKLRFRPTGVYLSVQQAGRKRASKGHYRRSIAENTKVGTLQGKISDGGVIYGPWLEGTSSRNQTTRFKGYGEFRKTYQMLEKEKGRVLSKHMSKVIRELNG